MMSKFTIKKNQMGYAFVNSLFLGGLYFIINSMNQEVNIGFVRELARYGPTTLVIGFFVFLGGCGFFIINNNVKKNKN